MAYSSSQTAQSPAPSVPVSTNPTLSGAGGFLVLVFALSVVLLLLGYRKYCACQRSRLLKRQIAMLEAMWRISSTK